MEKHLRPAIAEMVGTFFLVFIGAGVICVNAVVPGGGSGLAGVAIAHGLALSIAVTATMAISGGHCNPAVSITMWVYKKIDTDKLFWYVGAQLLGGVVAGAFLFFIFGSNDQVVRGVNLGTPHVNTQLFQGSSNFEKQFTAIGIEMILTFLLVFAVFGTTVDPRAPKVGGFCVGLTIAADILVGGPLTGASMNPARTFGPGLWEAFKMGGGAMWDHAVYWVGPVAGGLLAGGVYLNYLMPQEGEKTPAPDIRHGK